MIKFGIFSFVISQSTVKETFGHFRIIYDEGLRRKSENFIDRGKVPITDKGTDFTVIGDSRSKHPRIASNMEIRIGFLLFFAFTGMLNNCVFIFEDFLQGLEFNFGRLGFKCTNCRTVRGIGLVGPKAIEKHSKTRFVGGHLRAFSYKVLLILIARTGKLKKTDLDCLSVGL